MSLPTYEVLIPREEHVGTIFSTDRTDRQQRQQNPGKWGIVGHPGRYDSMEQAAEALCDRIGWCE